jgi:hypothetical protein
MNPNLVLSSCLFVIPTYYAYMCSAYGVAFLSFVCLLSSIINHSYANKISIIDTILVNIIGVFYTIHAIVYYARSKIMWFLITITCAICAIVLWSVNTNNNDNLHAIIHVLATIGMITYVKGLVEQNKSIVVI